jgi:peptidoglycan/xylan/chitin deacetylase (PgdA/CDA1 family)
MRAILTYHSIDGSGSPISIAPTIFARHLAWLRSGQVRVVPLAELPALGEGTNAVAITFDDALASIAAEALPGLIAAGLHATIFVTTAHVGGDNRWHGRAAQTIPVLPVMTWEQLAGAQASGIAIGAHTRTHPDLRQCVGEALQQELEGARDDVGRALGITPEAFAYPYGAHDRRIRDAASEVYRFSVTTDLRPLRGDDSPDALPRLDAWYFQDPRWLHRWGTAALRSYLGLRRAGRAVKRWVS